MQKREVERLTKLVSALAAAYGREADEPLFLAWELGLDGCPMSAIETAFAAAFKERSQFMPTPGTLRAAAMNGSFAPPATVEQRAGAAWALLLDVIRTIGAVGSVQFQDPAISAVVQDLGGWIAVCDVKTADLKWLEKDFLRHYAVYATTGVPSHLAGPLIGLQGQDYANGLTNTPRQILRVGCKKLPGPMPLLIEGGGQKPQQVALPAPGPAAVLAAKLKPADIAELCSPKPQHKLTHTPVDEVDPERVANRRAERERQHRAMEGKNASRQMAASQHAKGSSDAGSSGPVLEPVE